MDLKALHKISYGLYVVSSCKEGKVNGQMANAVMQVCSEPPSLAVGINKQNLTHEYIQESKTVVVSVLDQETPLALIGNFGFNSGRKLDKYATVKHRLTERGVPYLTEHCIAYLEGELVQEVDARTHTLYICEVVGAKVIGEGEPMTYAYYHQVKKGGVPPTAPTYSGANSSDDGRNQGATAGLEHEFEFRYECSVCGYIYDPRAGDPQSEIPPGTAFHNLPSDWVCPVCGAGKEAFKKYSI